MEVAVECCSGAAVRGIGNEIMLQARNYLVGMLEKGVFMRQVSSIGLGQFNRCNGDSMHVECDNRQVSTKKTIIWKTDLQKLKYIVI